MQHDLGVAAGLENRSVADQPSRSSPRVDQVAVVRDGDLPVRAIDQDRLGVLQRALARGRIAGVADGEVPGQRLRVGSSNASATWPMAREMRIFAPSAVAMPALSWPAVLQRVKAEVGQVGGLGMAEDAEDAALVFELVEHGWCAGSRSAAPMPLFYAARPSSCRVKWPSERRRPVALGVRHARQSMAGSPAPRCESQARSAGRARCAAPARRPGRRAQQPASVRLMRRSPRTRRRFAEAACGRHRAPC